MNGPVSWLSYAFRFQQLPLGLFGISIASATLPRIARSAAHNDMAEFRQTLSRSITMILLTTVPSSVGLAIFGESMIGLVYQHGRFLASDTKQTALALSCYAVGIAGFALLKLLAPAFYALGDARTPMLVTLVSVLLNAATSYTMVAVLKLGHAGLALSLSLVSIFNVCLLLLLIRRRIGGVHGSELVLNLAKIVLAAAVMACVCLFVTHAGTSRLIHVALGIPLSALVYCGVLSILRLRELDDARAALLRKLA
jgi:putative peptidoglycan lipid II flippase